MLFVVLLPELVGHSPEARRIQIRFLASFLQITIRGAMQSRRRSLQLPVPDPRLDNS